jgi:hypothetical protein
MIYLAIYLYLMGATVMWWFARSQPTPRAGKVIAVIGWPVIVPVAALWG